jgi:hypothetical protein
VEPEKTPRERAEDLIRLLMPDWRPTARQGLWAIRIVLASVAVLGILTLVSQPFGITLWDWLKLLVVPAVIAGGGIWFNRQQRERELAIANEQREREVEIAERRAQDEALQAYLDQMSDMLIPKTDRPSLYKARPVDSLSSVARARTLTMLPRLDKERKARVVQFLHESGLIAANRPIVAMRRADLRGADLSHANLFRVVLHEPYLHHANLFRANLSGANLSGTHLAASYLRGANLSKARGWTEEQLRAAKCLERATMPNGQKFEDWIKSRGEEG